MADKTEQPMRAPKTVTLKRSKIVMIYDQDFPTEAVIAAQKAAAKNSGMFALYLAQQVATFDGKRLTMGEIRERVRGKDYLQLTGVLLGDDEDGDEDGDVGPLN
ncbi:hypothetical protein [Phreatobacter stygius]|uniref:Uncharacterized protein n=1 Tax=Phreatobacter stygius TaxID=1940610 RepID=A0A4D7B5C7_9HYPH|nr:hypothetical protein [Phreatobacter stygius]QCI65628.1 hypothetical protein E8M01_16290 [Phreatobacter stygius]